MKQILLASLLFFMNPSFGQSSLDEWVASLKQRIIDGEDIRTFASNPVREDLIVDFVLVADLVVVHVDEHTIRMRMVGLKGEETGCLEFAYFQRSGQYFLEFSPEREVTVRGHSSKFVSPWTTKLPSCP
jgi:hypothetical protein